MTLNQAFAIRVRELLKEKHMTQSALENNAHIYHSTMNSILNGSAKTSNFKIMAVIIRELGKSISEFFNSSIFDFDNLIIE